MPRLAHHQIWTTPSDGDDGKSAVANRRVANKNGEGAKKTWWIIKEKGWGILFAHGWAFEEIKKIK